MSPYSIPLWTIFTKWPAPDGPQWSQPCSSGARVALAAWSALGRVDSRRERLEHGREPVDGLVVAADHQAEAALEAPDAAADADVDVVDPSLAQLARAARGRRRSTSCRRR